MNNENKYPPLYEAILFDLDGVLVETPDLHYKALNDALLAITKYSIPYDEHMLHFNGLPTKTKLNMLVQDNKINKDDVYQIIELKRYFTLSYLNSHIKYNKTIYNTIEYLHKQLKFKLACVSNAELGTINLCLKLLNVDSMFGVMISPQMGYPNKPDPTMYNEACHQLNVEPSKTIIFEDSPVGLQGASLTECAVHPLFKKDLTLNKMKDVLRTIYQYRAIYNENYKG